LRAVDDVLVFTSDVLTEPTEVTGRVAAKLFISSDCPDTDFAVKLTDVYPDGPIHAGHPTVFSEPLSRVVSVEEKFLEPGKVYEISIDLWSTSWIFNKGHKDSGRGFEFEPRRRFDPNPNTGHAFRADKERLA